MSTQVEFDGDHSYKGYFAIFDGENAKCSCGRPLVKVSGKVYRCSYGYPQYHLDSGEVIMDKFGNIYLKEKDHEEGK